WNVTALVDTSGAAKERYVYDPYGSVTYLTAAWATVSSSGYAWVYLHQGTRFVSAAGLYNHRLRDESPTLGRWLNPDPLRFASGDTNLQRYFGNDPTNCRDPQGLVSPLFSPNHTETTYAIINLIWPSRPTIPHVIKPTLPGNSSPTVLTAGKPSTTVPWVYPTGGLYIATIPTYYGN